MDEEDSEFITVSLSRESPEEQWGFTIKGGKGEDEPLVISKVSEVEGTQTCKSQ